MVRALMALALLAMVGLRPAPAEAQVYEFIKVCKRTVAITIACIVVENGVYMIVENNLVDWVRYFRKTKDTVDPERPPGKAEPPKEGQLEAFRSTGIDWREFITILDTMIGQKPLSPKSVEAILKASCATRINAVCAQFGLGVSDGLKRNCTAMNSQPECEKNILCTWQGSTCTGAGTKNILPK